MNICSECGVSIDIPTKQINQAIRLQELVNDDIQSLKHLDEISMKTFGEKLWKHDIRKLETLLKESTLLHPNQ